MDEHSVHQDTAAVPGAAEDGREAYQPPELRDWGSVTEMTQTGASQIGSDVGYS